MMQKDLEGLPTHIELPTGEITITCDKLSRQKSYQAPGYQAEFPDEAYDSLGRRRGKKGSLKIAFEVALMG